MRNVLESRIEELRDKTYMNIEIELAESLPLCNRKNEILFYYNTVSKEGYYFFDEIYHLFYINRETGDIERVDQSEIIPDDIKDDIEFSVIPFDDSLDGNEVYNLEEEYETLYNWFVKNNFKENLSKEEKNKLQRLKDIFEKLIPDCPLRDIYLSLGYEMFDYIDNNINGE